MSPRLDIKVTFQCNNCCKFCVYGERRIFLPAKTKHEMKSILKNSKDNYREVIFTGGEVTTRPDIVELVTFAKKLGYRIQIQTNGRNFCDKRFCLNLIKAGAEEFAISIHGHNPEIHDYLTGVQGSFAQTSAGIRNLLGFGQIVLTNTVITKLNYRFLSEIAKYLIKIGVPKYQFAFPHILGDALKNRASIVPRKKDIIPYVKKGLDIGIRRKRPCLVEAIPYCFLKGYEYCISDMYIPDAKVVNANENIIENFTQWRKQEGKIKGPRCKVCMHFQYCEGPWREYPQFYGWSEFKPVK